MRRTPSTSTDVRRAIGLIRAVNVGGRGSLRMADLRDLLEGLGYADPQTLLQSGNVTFGLSGRRRADSAAKVEERIEAELRRQLSLDVDVFVRSDQEWDEVIAANPFTSEAVSDPSHLVLMTLRDAPPAPRVAALVAAIAGPETLRASGRHLYIVYPNGMGTSKLTGTLIERTLGTRGTARNWNTVLKLATLVHAGR